MPTQQGLESEPPIRGNVFVPPYPLSWLDRLTAWVDRLPGPAWFFYLVFAAITILAVTVIQWREGAYPVGTFDPLHAWAAANFACLLAFMHYLDRSAFSAIASFRPLLSSAGAGAKPSLRDLSLFAQLSYQLTTLPPRPTLLATIAGPMFAIVAYVGQTAAGAVPSFLARTAGTSFSNASVLALVVLQSALWGVFVYHTIHQLILVSQIYTQHARINVYRLQPLYALSLPGAFTAIGVLLLLYVWIALDGTPEPVDPLAIALLAAMAVIAGATFALPLVGAHRRLVHEKDRRLAEAASRFEAAAEELHRKLDSRSLGQVDNLTKALAGLEIEVGVLRRIPTWPWQPGAVRSVSAALLLPLAIWALQLLLGRVLGG